MSSAKRRAGIAGHQRVFVRHCNTLRNRIYEWDGVLRSSTGENWPWMLGHLNAAMNQTIILDQSIEDVTNHLVYEPKKSTMNPQDIPVFLSVRLVDDSNKEQNSNAMEDSEENGIGDDLEKMKNSVARLTQYEKLAADLAKEFEQNMVRY